jgi:ATP-dependent DNA helicase DinG
LFARVPAVLVSATLGPGARFEPLARRLGLDPAAPEDSEELGRGYVALRVESPFDHRSQARLYVPRHIPDVRDAAWQGAAADELCSLVEAAGGRALVLCTSWRSVNEFSAVLRERTSHTILAQGDQPVPRLVAGFADDETSCLVATRAFWMGLDVPGPACVLVVIDRLPFTRPDEPLEQARREAAERAGGNGFLDVALVLAQGAGRLIRRKDDHGVVAVLDRRLATARYRSVLLEGLPPMRRIVEADEAHEFLARATALRSRSDHEKPQSSGT